MPAHHQLQLNLDATGDTPFETWCADNPDIISMVRSAALQLKRAGVGHYGMRAIFEHVRFHTALRSKGDTFKINNNHTPLLARKLMTEVPELEGFFETRDHAKG